MSAGPKWRQAVHRGFEHHSSIVAQHRRELDELRARLDAIEGTDTHSRRKLIHPDAPEDPTDRIRGLWRGTWQDDGTVYRRNDLLTDKGGLWVCVADETAARPGSDPGSWVLVAKGGRGARVDPPRGA